MFWEEVVRKVTAERKGSWLLRILHPNETKADRIARAVKQLAVKLKVEPVTKTNVIDVQYSSSDPHLSYSVLETLGDLYVEKHVAVHRPPGTLQFFAEQTDQYQKALQISEAQLRDFDQKHQLAAPDQVQTDLALQLTDSIGHLHAAQQAEFADQKRIDKDKELEGQTPQRSTTAQSSNAPAILLEQLGTALLAAETKRTQLLLKYDATYPLVKESDQEIAQAKAAIAEAQNTSC